MKAVVLALHLCAGLLSAPLAAIAGAANQPLHTVPSVDLARYAGTWHEIARYPNFFQKGCRDATAVYTLTHDGELSILNRCLKGETGEVSEAKGKGWVVSPPDAARLKVSFFWLFRGDYWIIDLGKEYEYAVVGTPDRESLWILARQPKLPADVYAGILARLKSQGFDPSRLETGRE
jgi:apolipoprotein D and lipocalin family protein